MELTKERLQVALENLRLTHKATQERSAQEVGAIQAVEELVALLDQPEPEAKDDPEPKQEGET